MPIDGQEYDEVGFIKYVGRDVDEGVIDAGSAGSALLGLDDAIRFFNAQQSPDFAGAQYDLPIQTRKGSWEIAVLGVAGVFAASYAKKAAEKMAENDFKDLGFIVVLKKSLSAIQNFAKLVKHTKRTGGWEAIRFAPHDPTGTVLVANDAGQEIGIPVEQFKWFQRTPPRLLMRMTSVVRIERTMTIGVHHADSTVEESIGVLDRPLFDPTSDEDLEGEFLFPELQHGQWASLEGKLIRGSEKSNNAGLEFRGHVINCVPSTGNIRQYKAALFLHCKVSGRISRHHKNRYVADRRPTLILDQVVPLETDAQISLLGD